MSSNYVLFFYIFTFIYLYFLRTLRRSYIIIMSFPFVAVIYTCPGWGRVLRAFSLDSFLPRYVPLLYLLFYVINFGFFLAQREKSPLHHCYVPPDEAEHFAFGMKHFDVWAAAMVWNCPFFRGQYLTHILSSRERKQQRSINLQITKFSIPWVHRTLAQKQFFNNTVRMLS